MTDITPNQMRDRLGNIDQIRDILFGDREREYTERIDRIEADLEELSQAIELRLTALETQMTSDLQTAVNSLEKKIQFVSSSLNSESSEIRQSLQTVERDLAGNIVIVEKTLSASLGEVETSLSNTRSQLKSGLQELKSQLLDEIEKNFNGLGGEKVSRTELAEMFFELCMQMRGQSDSSSEAETAQATFLLPDRQFED
ncbi:MAG: hypothetical protein EAZ61_01520 [Oscillatoriales cyanobacterium]|jgi:DNA anti-recombination protein RmuC|nr:MAG: hypothetical protein EAZ61_01520 [Oscillatoriales cyanobacterium]